MSTLINIKSRIDGIDLNNNNNNNSNNDNNNNGTATSIVYHHHLMHFVCHHHHVQYAPIMRSGQLLINGGTQHYEYCADKLKDWSSSLSLKKEIISPNELLKNNEKSNDTCSSHCSSGSQSVSVSGSSTPTSNHNCQQDDINAKCSSFLNRLAIPSHSTIPVSPLMHYHPVNVAQNNCETFPPISHSTLTNQVTLLLPLKDIYASLGVLYQPVAWNQSFGMERVWMSEFRRIFSNFYSELWSIQPVDKKPNTLLGIKLHMFVDSAKVRFCCEKCSHSWTSMKGRVVFWFDLLPPNFNIGIVAIKLFGQLCDACKLGNYEQPMWYPEEVTKVLSNLYNRVGQIFHGFEKTKYERQRRVGKPRTQHNKILCQACIEGICLNRNFSRTNSEPTVNNVEQNEMAELCGEANQQQQCNCEDEEEDEDEEPDGDGSASGEDSC